MTDRASIIAVLSALVIAAGGAAPGIAGRFEAPLGVAQDRVDAAEEQVAGRPGHHLPGPVPKRRAGARVESFLQIGDPVLEVQARRRHRLGDRQVEVDQVEQHLEDRRADAVRSAGAERRDRAVGPQPQTVE